MAPHNTYSNVSVKRVVEKYSCHEVVRCARKSHTHAMLRLRDIRKARGLTQADLADAAGVTQGFISRIEKDNANPTIDVIEALASVLRVRPIDLFPEDQKNARIIAAFEALDPDLQDHAIAILERLARSD